MADDEKPVETPVEEKKEEEVKPVPAN